MRHALPKPVALPRLGIWQRTKALLVRPEEKRDKRGVDSIFSLACQRCAGFTTRPSERKERDY